MLSLQAVEQGKGRLLPTLRTALGGSVGQLFGGCNGTPLACQTGPVVLYSWKGMDDAQVAETSLATTTRQRQGTGGV